MTAAPDPPPQLDAPGVGLPAVEAWLLRHVLFPLGTTLTSRAKARSTFLAEADRIMQLAAPLSDDDLVRPILIDRIPGIEDSSRNWSVAMTIEHLIIVGTGAKMVIKTLSQRREPTRMVDIAAVKPHGVGSVEIRKQFRTFCDKFAAAFDDTEFPRTPRHLHPWFGPLSAGKWFKLAAIHQQLHRKQVERIIAGL